MLITLHEFIHDQLAHPHKKYKPVRDSNGVLRGLEQVSLKEQLWYATPMGLRASDRLTEEMAEAVIELRERHNAAIANLRTTGSALAPETNGWGLIGHQLLTTAFEDGQGKTIPIRQRIAKICQIDLNGYSRDAMARLAKLERAILIKTILNENKGKAPKDADTWSIVSSEAGFFSVSEKEDTSRYFRMRDLSQRAETHNRIFSSVGEIILDAKSLMITRIEKQKVKPSPLDGTFNDDLNSTDPVPAKPKSRFTVKAKIEKAALVSVAPEKPTRIKPTVSEEPKKPVAIQTEVTAEVHPNPEQSLALRRPTPTPRSIPLPEPRMSVIEDVHISTEIIPPPEEYSYTPNKV